ncbi:MED7-domain-containing protein, partial [Suhomyces tanzawaensis NRRL Y-17324]
MSGVDGDLISSLYPPPPVYYKYFTPENIEKFQEWKTKQDEETLTTQDQQPEEADTTKEPPLPPGELKLQVPPKAPEGTHYRGYGNVWAFEDKLPSLKSANWEQLYKDDDESITSETKIQELHKLMDSLLLNFLELIGIASIDPKQFEPKMKDISLILININHLLNTYRPHQSRESMIMLLRKQIDAKKEEIAKIDLVSVDVKAKILKLTEMID